ncbi:unnamed protein product [Diamesa serratosioi]
MNRRKRSDKNDDGVPSKKRHLEEGKFNQQENVADVTNILSMTHQSSSRRVLQEEEIRKKIEGNLKSGKIKRIHLKNFMCHGNFQVNLNSNVNVFVGDNGSGKSAILAALAIGLGSKASSTSRSTNLKELVKRGETTAQIEITLTNDGLDSFEEDIYGKQITVVRTINATSGSSTYKLKNATGQVISTSRKDLTKMTMYLNIQVENPVLILNQDAARSFLKECDPKKLYQFFLKATQIETIIEKLNSCFQSAANSKSKLDHLNMSCKQMDKEITVIKEKHEKLQSVAKLRIDIAKFKNELNWLHVHHVVQEMLECRNELEIKRAKLTENRDFIKNRAKIELGFEVQIAAIGDESKSIKDLVDSKNESYEQFRVTTLKEQDELAMEEQIFKTIERKKDVLESNIVQLRNDIESRDDNPTNVENLKKENNEKIALLDEKASDVFSMLETARRDHRQYNDTVEQYAEQIKSCHNQKSQMVEAQRKCSAQITQLDTTGKNSLSAYGRGMAELVEKVQRLYSQGKFSELPRGPMGSYIEVPDKKYRNAIENILGAIVHAFFVNCDKDRILLSKILKEDLPHIVNHTQIITGKFTTKLYDVRNGAVQIQRDQGKVLMDLITVKDNVVMNCLIDQRRIESVVLVENTEIAIALTSNEQNVPRNMQRVILLRPFSEYYPSPNYRSYTMNEKPARYIQVDMKEVVLAFEREKEMLSRKLEMINNKIGELQQNVREQNKHVDEKRTLVQKLTQKQLKIKSDLMELKNIEYPPENECEMLQTELDSLEARKKSLLKAYQNAETNIVALQKSVKEKSTFLKNFKEEMRTMKLKIQQLTSELEATRQRLSEIKNDVKNKKMLVITLEKEEREKETLEKSIQDRIDQMVAKIPGDRVNTDRTEAAILQTIKSTEKRITNIEAHHENIEDVELLLNSRTSQLVELQSVRDKFDHVLKMLTTVRDKRFGYVKRLKQHMSLKVKHKFHSLMGLRNYSAEILIDEKNKTLELKVIPRDSEIQGAVSNTKSLSGGERSFSTVAFLISLWSCVEHPFYFLDEYDVFSDEYNRHIMTLLLFDEAKKKMDKQYGFLTPQDFSNIVASDTLTIHKLHDPERMK